MGGIRSPINCCERLPQAPLKPSPPTQPVTQTYACGAMPPSLMYFEGTEKRIEVDFVVRGDARGLRQSTRWPEVVATSGTKILMHKSYPAFDSYILSESSLFVYPHKCVLKTCGITVPLASLDLIFTVAREVSCEPEWLSYSRKEFKYPGDQVFPHCSFEEEIKQCQLVCSVGNGYILGPVTGDHWLLFNADFMEVDGKQRHDQTIDIMMYDLPDEIRDLFYVHDADEGADVAANMTERSGLKTLFPECTIDGVHFSPCGYSCNAVIGDYYFTVHVTPEPDCSYASFETNLPADTNGGVRYEPGLLQKVIALFRPARFAMSFFADDGAVELLKPLPYDEIPQEYERQLLSSYHFQNDYEATVANYSKCVRKAEHLEKRNDKRQRSPFSILSIQRSPFSFLSIFLGNAYFKKTIKKPYLC